MKVKIINFFKSLSNDAKLIFYLFIFFWILLIIFFPLKLFWKNDPFQKIILAPLSEEPLKLIVALTLWFAVFKSVITLKIKQWEISDSFLNHFAIYAIIAGIALGLGEGPLGNIFLHAASSSIGAILILFIFFKVKNKPWNIGYKLTSIIITLSIPMFIHSLSNQFSSIYYVTVYPEFKYLVIIGRYLHDNTIITDSFRFDALMIVIAGCLLIIWYLHLFFQRDKGDASKKILGFRFIFAIGIIFGLILTPYRMISSLPVITYYLQHSVPISSFLLMIVTDFIEPILFILIPIAGLLLTKKPSEKNDKPTTKWGFRTLFVIGIILTVRDLSMITQFVIQFAPKSFWGDTVQIIYIWVFGFVFLIYFILMSIAGLWLTK
jgi:hypothetical protein